ncbi:hypothetical protein LTR50_004943 [Elasticomyces elasticus]|nr:hypothetical protein LTR50_004943 [Elasticomyces elasticus]
MATKDQAHWNETKYRRILETFDADDSPIIASGPNGEYDSICQSGELTDKGRATTLALGEWLRHLYVEQLGFMPKLIMNADNIYLRTTPVPRALESLQQSFWGMYPAHTRTAQFPAPTIVTRSPADETLYLNKTNCRRFAQLSQAFSQRTADHWNESKEMNYLNKLISTWMPLNSRRVAVDSHPSLYDIMDTINSTLAHGLETRLPSEFYNSKGRDIMDRIVVEEWVSGFNESEEYQSLGVGSLVGDIVTRMAGNVIENRHDSVLELGGEGGKLGRSRIGEAGIRFGLSVCHDTTLAAVLASLGTFNGKKWPPYTSHIAVELFRKARPIDPYNAPKTTSDSVQVRQAETETKPKTWWFALFGKAKDVLDSGPSKPSVTARRPVEDLTDQEKRGLDGYYVRLRYNDKIMTVPGCKPAGKHFPDDESFCTLEAFKSITDKYTPAN